MTFSLAPDSLNILPTTKPYPRQCFLRVCAHFQELQRRQSDMVKDLLRQFGRFGFVAFERLLQIVNGDGSPFGQQQPKDFRHRLRHQRQTFPAGYRCRALQDIDD
jgi:hypothetical protein